MMDKPIEIIKMLELRMESYGVKIFNALSVGCLSLFMAAFGCWFVWQLIWKGAIKGEFHFSDFLKPFLISISISILLTASTFSNWFYLPINETVAKLVETMISVIKVNYSGSKATLFSVLKFQYGTLNQVFESMSLMMQDTGIIPGFNTLASIIMRIPFLFLYIIMLCYCLDYMFKLMAVTALSPLLIIFAGFSSTRSISTSGLKMVLHGVFTILISVIAMGLSLYVLKESLHLIPLDGNGILREDAGSFAFSDAYWTCFIIACLSIYLQLKVPTIANIAGASDGPGAAGFVAGVSSATMGMIGGGAKHYGQKGAQKAWGAVKGWAGPKIKNHLSSRGSSWENPALNNIIGSE
ncbi:hypothetical protein IM40_11225 (plasmid) [Candidatus Paracaedimonas acanthamoebae]|nr:hypothetical protein IM40_09245 [Candidatus Paracaedimonas acanthamoebae]AIL13901.1 hypothetical protein IM40_11225 [Candidatus Paracaedimonas acanthamoebae]